MPSWRRELRARAARARTTTPAAGKPACRLGRPGGAGGAGRRAGPRRVRDAGAAGRPRTRRRRSSRRRELLATVLGQDLDRGAEDGVFRIARRVATDRVISTVDPEARHGHKTAPAASTATRGISRSTRTPRSSPPPRSPPATAATPRPPRTCSPTSCPADQPKPKPKPKPKPTADGGGSARRSTAMPPTALGNCWPAGQAGADINGPRCSRRPALKGHFPKDRFAIDLDARHRDLPGRCTVPIRPGQGRRRHRRVRRGLRRLPAGRPVHHLRRRTHHHHRPPRGRNWPPPATGRPTPPGKPTTGPPAPRSNARSAT